MNEKIDKYEIERIENNGKHFVKVYNNNAKKEYNRTLHYFVFRKEQEREEWITNFKKSVQNGLDYKTEKKAARMNFKNPAQTGDILQSSWGYDQTNVDHYQVVKVIGKMVDIQEIGSETVPGSTQSHGMADSVRPVKGRFLKDSKPMRKFVKSFGDNGYCVTIASYTDAYKVSEDSQTYRSWYA